MKVEAPDCGRPLPRFFFPSLCINKINDMKMYASCLYFAPRWVSSVDRRAVSIALLNLILSHYLAGPKLYSRFTQKTFNTKNFQNISLIIFDGSFMSKITHDNANVYCHQTSVRYVRDIRIVTCFCKCFVKANIRLDWLSSNLIRLCSIC